MTDPYRYLPCGLHEALDVPDGFVSGSTPGPFTYRSDIEADVVDLANPHGWDHAVRAYASIKGVEVPESASVGFWYEPEAYIDIRTPSTGAWMLVVDGEGTVMERTERPTDRRESLCRCICAALGLDVGAVFPVKQR